MYMSFEKLTFGKVNANTIRQNFLRAIRPETTLLKRPSPP